MIAPRSFFGEHRTKDGINMPIATMTNEHLLNLIRSRLGRVGEIRAALQRSPDAVSTEERVQASMYKIRVLTPEEAADHIRGLVDELMPYLLEAYLRNMPEPRLLLIQAIGRDAALGALKFAAPALPEPSDL